MAICDKGAGSVINSGARSILYPVSTLELSVQERFIWLEDTAVALRLLGADGLGCVLALAVFEYAELPAVIVCTHPVVVGGIGAQARVGVGFHICPDRGNLRKGAGSVINCWCPLDLVPGLNSCVVSPGEIYLA